jgi:hypothetical protein
LGAFNLDKTGARIPSNPQSAIRNPQSAIRNPQSAILDPHLFEAALKNRLTSASLRRRNSPGFNLSFFKNPIPTRRSLITEWPM